MKALRYTPTEIEIEITGISLLTIEEVEVLPENIRQYGDDWWLRTPGFYSYHAAYVSNNGSIGDYGGDVDDVDDYGVSVRPTLTVANLDSLNLKIGDILVIKNKKYIYIGDNRVLYNDKAVYHRFDKESNDYEKSEIKKIVDKWLER